MSNLPATITNLIDNLNVARSAVPAASDAAFLKMDKTGVWIYGADDTEIDPDSTFCIDPAKYVQGFIAWDDGELVDECMAQAGDPPILKSELPHLEGGVKWDAQVGFTLLGVEGGEDGVILEYKSSSRGGKILVSAILNDIISRAKTGKTDLCPVVELSSDHYKHKKFGKIYTPEYNIVEWLDLPSEAAEPVVAAEPEPEPEPEPKVKVKVKPRRRRKTAE